MQVPRRVGPRVGGQETPEADWYVVFDDREFGPFKFDELANFANQGQLGRTDLIWTAAYDHWVPAGELPELFARPRPPARPTTAPWSVGREDQIRTDGAEGEPEKPPVLEAATASSTKKESNYFVRQWRGELSLPVSYWINGFLGNVVAIWCVAKIGASANPKGDFIPGAELFSSLFIWGALLLLALWQLVGTWRSATNYRQAHPKSYWGGIAKFMLAIGALNAIAGFGQNGAPQIAEYYNIYAGDKGVGEHTFRVLRDGEELEFSGGIAFGAAKELDRFLNAMGALKVVHLNSLGGRILEAQKMGELIRQRNLSTYVSNRCLSACTIVFLNGRERLIGDDAQVGFHQPDFPGLTDRERKSVIALEERRLRRLGVSEQFARKANQAPPNRMWYPTVAELLNERVATRLVNSDDLGFSGYSASDISAERIQEALLANPIYESIRRIDPDAYREIYDRFEIGLRRGSGLAELHAQLSPITIAVMLDVLPHTPQPLLLDFTRFVVGAARTLNSDSPESCYFYFNAAKANPGAILEIRKKYKSVASGEDDLAAKILQSFVAKVLLPTEEEISASLEMTRNALVARHADLELLDNETVPPTQYAKYCSILADLYEQTLKLPPNEAAALLRYWFSTK